MRLLNQTANAQKKRSEKLGAGLSLCEYLYLSLKRHLLYIMRDLTLIVAQRCIFRIWYWCGSRPGICCNWSHCQRGSSRDTYHAATMDKPGLDAPLPGQPWLAEKLSQKLSDMASRGRTPPTRRDPLLLWPFPSTVAVSAR